MGSHPNLRRTVFLFFCLLFASTLISCQNNKETEAGPPNNVSNPYPKEGDLVGNGGSVVIDGKTYRLADLYFKPYVGATFTFSGPLRKRLELLSRLLPNWRLNTRKFFKNHVLSELVQFKFVAQLPSNCLDEMEVDPELATAQFACTRGYYTWIIPKYFIELTLEERAAAIVHERLHASAPSQPHEVIAPFVKGLILFQKLYAQVASKPTLTEPQLETLKLMRFAGRQLGLRDETAPDYGPSNWVMLDTGAMATKEAEIDESAYLSVGTSVDVTRIGAGSQIIGSYLDGDENPNHAGEVDSNVLVLESWLTFSAIEKNTKITHSQLYLSEVGENVQIDHMKCIWRPAKYGSKITIETGSTISNVTLDKCVDGNWTIPEKSTIVNSTFSHIRSYSWSQKVRVINSNMETFPRNFKNTVVENSDLKNVIELKNSTILNSQYFTETNTNSRLTNLKLIGTVIKTKNSQILHNAEFFHSRIVAKRIYRDESHTLSEGCQINEPDKAIRLFNDCKYEIIN